jgi:hypothetical protein
MTFVDVLAHNTHPEINVRFTRGGFPALPLDNRRFVWAEPASDVLSHYTLQDCQLANCYFFCSSLVSNATVSIDFSNNLFEYGSLVFSQTNSTYFPFTLNFRNNLLHGGILDMGYNSTNTVWTCTDNLFESATTTTGAFSFNLSNNGYYATTSLGGSSNITLLTLDFQTGPLGRYYYPTNGTGLNLLIDAGSRTADLAGLYHYTSSTNQVKETNSVVNIGFHYVATDANGLPLDFDGDIIPDYLEDSNGNGTADTGETDWQAYNSLSGLLSTPGLEVYTPIFN